MLKSPSPSNGLTRLICATLLAAQKLFLIFLGNILDMHIGI